MFNFFKLIFTLMVISFKGYTSSLIGIGESPIENEKWIHKWLPNTVDEAEKFLEIQDDKIANIPVRIYKPKTLFNDTGKKLTGVVYLHGGGWTIGSVGRLDVHVLFQKISILQSPKEGFFGLDHSSPLEILV